MGPSSRATTIPPILKAPETELHPVVRRPGHSQAPLGGNRGRTVAIAAAKKRETTSFPGGFGRASRSFFKIGDQLVADTPTIAVAASRRSDGIRKRRR
jgi:hypothetical protein